VVAHAKYLINLASPFDERRARSARALARELVAAGALGADLVVVHSGSHGGAGEEVGLERLAQGLDEARRLAEDFAAPSGRVAEPILENSVGAGTQLCSTFEALGAATRRTAARVCVDTAHAFVAGYDLSTPEGTRAVAEELKAAVGDRLALVHLNDAKYEIGSRRDGHCRIGEGRVPEGCWRAFFAALPGVPVVMETPYGTPEVDAEQVRLVKELADGLPNEPVGR
jgi:deoxyribonuclease IV